MNRDRLIHIMGGTKDDDGNFTIKREATVKETDLGAYMRRDWIMCQMDVIKLRTIG